MARAPRSLTIDENKEGFYHVCNQVAGSPLYLPFRNPRARRRFLCRFLFHLRGTYCRIAALGVMGNHLGAALLERPVC